MFFVAVGFIILFVSFLIALVSLIREQGQRVSEPDFEDQDDLIISAQTVPVVEQDNSFPPPESSRVQTSLPSKISEASSLEETVPFPWEIEEDNFQKSVASGGLNSAGEGKIAEDVSIDNASINLGASQDNLTGEISLSDLRRQQ